MGTLWLKIVSVQVIPPKVAQIKKVETVKKTINEG
jgi:hypothetical protein